MKASGFLEVKQAFLGSVKQRFRYSGEALQQALAEQHYYLDISTCKKLAAYLALGKPVGLRGEPGVGKSELPERIARLLSANLIDIECHSQLEAMDIGVSWNGFRQIVDAQTSRLTTDPFSLSYLNRTPLVESLLSTEPVVVRIDEVDKLNENTSNFFLRYLDKQELVVHDLVGDNKILRAKSTIHVFLTSNDYRHLDPAMMRRIAWIELGFPSEAHLARIIHSKTQVPMDMAERIGYVIHRLRTLPLEKKPSIGEALDWTRGLILETDGHLTLESIQITLPLLLKYPEDERKGWEAIQTWVSETRVRG